MNSDTPNSNPNSGSLSTILHDEIAGPLSIARMILTQINGDIQANGKENPNLTQVIKLITNVSDKARSLSHRLNQNATVSNLQELKNKLELLEKLVHAANPKLKIQFHKFDTNKQYSSQHWTFIFECFKELITNTLKHAKATEIHCNMFENTSGNCFIMTYNDNGVFEQKKLHTDGIGLLNIIKNVQLLNGEVVFSQLEPTGFSAHLEIPNSDE